MQSVRVIFAFVFLVFSWCGIALAQEGSIQVLNSTGRLGIPGGGRLFWTADTGGQWKDITPVTAFHAGIASIYFLDTSTGWVLLAGDDEPGPRFDVASTTSAGEIRPQAYAHHGHIG